MTDAIVEVKNIVRVDIKEKNLTGKEVSPALITTEIDTRAKISRYFLTAQSVNIDTLKNFEADLFSNDFELIPEQDRQKLKDRFNLIIKDFKGLKLTYWQKKVIISCYCLIERQGANKNRPAITITNKTDLYREVLEKDKPADGYNWGERKLFDKALEELQTQKQQIVFFKTTMEKKKKIREYVMVEAPLISSIITHYKENPKDNAETSHIDIKEKGEKIISLNPVIFDGLIDKWRLVPKNIAREIKGTCEDIKRVTPIMEDFIFWLHSHSPENNPVRRNRETLIKELGLEQEYKHNKKRVKEKLLETYDIAKRTGYLTKYETDIKGSREYLDVFYLNPSMYEHLKPKKVETTQEVITAQ